MDGYEVTRQIRTKQNMPIIFLSAKTSDFDKVTGLVLGADDYMTKPFTPIELVARVNAQLRRFLTLNQPKVEEETSVLEAGGVVIDFEKRTVHVYGERIDLTPKEFDILYLLASHPKKYIALKTFFSRYGQMIIMMITIIQLRCIFVLYERNLEKIKGRTS